MNELAADAFFQDSSVKKAKEEILAAIEKHKQKITQIRPPFPGLKISYQESVQLLESLRGQDLFYHYIGSGFGHGALVELADGSVKLDFISGIGTFWGHGHPKMVEAALEGSLEDICMQTNLQQNRDIVNLCALLTKHAELDHCFLTTSGAMANENALKILFQKKAPAYRVLAFERCFMGRSLALAQITDRPRFREGLPSNFHVDYVPFYDWRDPKGSTERALFVLEKHLNRYPGQHACMSFELIQGEAGNYPGTQEFFTALMKQLKVRNIAILVDEVQTFGRTDHLFAFQHFRLQPYVDVVTCGKLCQVCATLFKDAFKPKPGLIAQTFVSTSAAIKVSLALIKALTEDGYLGSEGKNMQIRKHFVEHLTRLADKYPKKIEGPFGHGLMIACTPFKGDKEKVTEFAKTLFESGLITYTAGSDPTRLRFLVPQGSVTFEDIDQAAMILENLLVEKS